MSEQDGGPAFPFKRSERIRFVTDGAFDPEDPRNFALGEHTYSGMSLRDYLAGQALGLGGEWFHNNGSDVPSAIASDAYELADAMLEARKR